MTVDDAVHADPDGPVFQLRSVVWVKLPAGVERDRFQLSGTGSDQICDRPGDEGLCVRLRAAPAPALSLAGLAIALAAMALLARRALRQSGAI